MVLIVSVYKESEISSKHFNMFSLKTYAIEESKMLRLIFSKSAVTTIEAVLSILLIIAAVFAGYFAYLVYFPPAPELTVASLWSGAEEENFLQALGNFTEDTDIEVRHIGYSTEELLIGVPTQFAAGASIADLVIAPWPAWIRNFAENDHLVDVTDMINASKYPELYMDAVTTDDKIWAVPFKASGKPGFWYKKSFFTAHELSVPTTYAEFKTLLADITAVSGIDAAIASGDDVGWPLSDTTEAFIMGLGGYQLQEDLITGPSVRNWTDTQVKAVFGNLTELLQEDYFSLHDEWTGQITKLWNEKYGIYFMGSWMTTMTQIGDVADLDFFPFPETTGVAGAVDYIIIPEYTENLDEAKQLFEYLAGPEAQEIMVRLGGFFGTHADVPDDAYTTLDKKVLDFIKTVHVVPDLDDAIGGRFQTTFWDQLKALWASPSTATMNSVLDTLQEVALEEQA